MTCKIHPMNKRNSLSGTDFITNKRIKRGLSQKAAGAAMGVSQSTYNRIENTGTTNLDHIASLAEVLKVSRTKMIRVMDEIGESVS